MTPTSELLPDPLPPITPIFAPGKKASVMSSSTRLSGGWTRVTFCIVKMNSGMTSPF